MSRFVSWGSTLEPGAGKNVTHGSVRFGAAAELFRLAAAAFGVEPARFTGEGGFGFPSGSGSDGGRSKQLHETLQRVLPVAELRAIASGVEDQYALLGHPAARLSGETLLDRRRQGR